jgi:hypothetical protein
MAVMEPAAIPSGQRHLDEADRRQLLRFELLVAQGRHEAAQEVVEDLWAEAVDAHKRLYQGLANALTAVCAREARQRRGAREIAGQTRVMLAPYPRRALGFDLDALLESVDDFIERGSGQILLLRQG